VSGARGPSVVFVCPNLEAGGAERQWASLVPGLRAAGFDVRVMTLDGRGAYFETLQMDGVPIACARLRHAADPIGLVRAVRLAGRGFSVVVSRGVSAHVVGHVLARTRKAAHVVTEHLGPDPDGLRPLSRRQRLLLGPVRPRIAAVAVVAASQAEHLVRDGYPPEAIRPIPNGVASDPPVRSRDAVRAELGVPAGAFLAVLVANLRPEKRAAAFVDQVAAAHAAEPAIQGMVVGDGPEAGLVARAVDRAGGAVRMLGFRSDALDVIHAADVMCLTSAVEASPMVVLEAMSLGRPVVASNVGGVADVVVSGETGVLVPPERLGEMADALVSLARDPVRVAELGAAGRRRQREAFSLEAMIDGYAGLLLDVTRPRREHRLAAARHAARP
jgi:glycosyltransferase involved in cell wall biosynthesis